MFVFHGNDPSINDTNVITETGTGVQNFVQFTYYNLTGANKCKKFVAQSEPHEPHKSN